MADWVRFDLPGRATKQAWQTKAKQTRDLTCTGSDLKRRDPQSWATFQAQNSEPSSAQVDATDPV